MDIVRFEAGLRNELSVLAKELPRGPFEPTVISLELPVYRDRDHFGRLSSFSLHAAEVGAQDFPTRARPGHSVTFGLHLRDSSVEPLLGETLVQHAVVDACLETRSAIGMVDALAVSFARTRGNSVIVTINVPASAPLGA